MYAAKSNWLRYPQYKPTKGEGFYKIMTNDGVPKIIQFSKLTQWNPLYVGAFVDELVTREKPNPVKQTPGLTTPGRRSLYREFMDAGNYAQFTDMENPAQSPLLSQLQKLTASLPDESMMEELEGAMRTVKQIFNSSNLESSSVKFEVEQLLKDILDIRIKLKRVSTSVDSIVKDISVKGNPSQDAANVDINSMNYNQPN